MKTASEEKKETRNRQTWFLNSANVITYSTGLSLAK